MRAPEDLQRLQQTPQKPSRQWLAVLPTTSGSVKDGLFEILPEKSPSQLPGQLLDNPASVQARLHEQGTSEVFLLPLFPCAIPQLGVQGFVCCFLWNEKATKEINLPRSWSWSCRHWDMAQGSAVPPVPQAGALQGMLTFTAGAAASRGTMETWGCARDFTTAL